jgi:hypothetical protein
LFLQGKADEEIYTIHLKLKGKICVVQFKHGDISMCVAPRLERSKTGPNFDIFDQIQYIMLEEYHSGSD